MIEAPQCGDHRLQPTAVLKIMDQRYRPIEKRSANDINSKGFSPIAQQNMLDAYPAHDARACATTGKVEGRTS